MIDGIPVNETESGGANSITSHAKNSQDVLGFEYSNKERSSRTKEEVSKEK